MSGFRVKCAHCGEVANVTAGAKCPKCSNPIDTDQPGMLQLYRMGSPIGIAVGFGIYIDGQPYGHLGNKESIRIPLPYGTYTLHITAGMSRRCKDLTVVLSPEEPLVCAKVHLDMGLFTNTVAITKSDPSVMPRMD